MSSSTGATPDSADADGAGIDPTGVGQTAPDLSRAVWRKCSYSGSNGSCVEAADLGEHIAVRDSKDRNGPKLIFTREVWRAFLADVRAQHH